MPQLSNQYFQDPVNVKRKYMRIKQRVNIVERKGHTIYLHRGLDDKLYSTNTRIIPTLSKN